MNETFDNKLMNVIIQLREDIVGVRGDIEGIKKDNKQFQHDITTLRNDYVTSRRTPWGLIIGAGSLLISLIGLCSVVIVLAMKVQISPLSVTAEANKAKVEHLETTTQEISKASASRFTEVLKLIAEEKADLDTVLQREMRQYVDVIMAELRSLSSRQTITEERQYDALIRELDRAEGVR